MTDLDVMVGGTLEDDAAAFLSAWKRTERGEKVDERVLAFESWERLATVMTGERYRLLRHLHAHPEPSISALARAPHRQYRRVHADIAALEQAGLLDRSQGVVRTTADTIRADIPALGKGRVACIVKRDTQQIVEFARTSPASPSHMHRRVSALGQLVQRTYRPITRERLVDSCLTVSGDEWPKRNVGYGAPRPTRHIDDIRVTGANSLVVAAKDRYISHEWSRPSQNYSTMIRPWPLMVRFTLISFTAGQTTARHPIQMKLSMRSSWRLMNRSVSKATGSTVVTTV